MLQLHQKITLFNNDNTTPHITNTTYNNNRKYHSNSKTLMKNYNIQDKG